MTREPTGASVSNVPFLEAMSVGKIVAMPQLGGLHHGYERVAAKQVVCGSIIGEPQGNLTGIEGQYSFSLTFAPETTDNLPRGAFIGADATAPAADAAPSVFDAVKPYGFRLEARKAPIEMLTVIHLEKTPIEN